ncbi:MAG: adenylate kinase [Bacilli bacterium]|nr:adenylate kinase [Bacilli bacterium]
MNIIFVAPPAAGKGTQSNLLVEKYGLAHISTGDLLREESNSGSELGNKLKVELTTGKLISDEIVINLLKNRLMKDDIKNGFILDGYPRSLEQARLLEGILDELNMKIDHVLYLDMDKELAMHRALGRLTCPKCGKGYNKYEEVMKPKVDGKCDDCHVDLECRSDDNEETFNTRFDTYINNTQPLLDYYKERELLTVIDNSGTPEETFNKIKEVII